MSQQVWALKLAQDLQPGDLIGSQTSTQVAIEIKSVEVQEDKVVVIGYDDLYKRFTRTYHMRIDQPIPTAKTGVEHLDKITNFRLSE